jgi:hypothetical protein
VRRLLLSGVSHAAALPHIEPARVTVKGFGKQVVLEAPDGPTLEQWIDHMAEVACTKADAGDWATHDAIAKDMDRAGGTS